MARGTVSVQKPEAGMVAAPAAVNAARLPVTGRGRTGSRFSSSATAVLSTMSEAPVTRNQ